MGVWRIVDNEGHESLLPGDWEREFIVEQAQSLDEQWPGWAPHRIGWVRGLEITGPVWREPLELVSVIWPARRSPYASWRDLPVMAAAAVLEGDA